jgi:hypothetical protein
MLDRARPITISDRVSRVALPPARILLQRQMRMDIDVNANSPKRYKP